MIESDDITAIKNGAFSGCESTNLTSAFDACCGDDIEPDAFAGSAFAKQPFINGVKMAGNIVIDIDKASEEIIIPDDDYEKAIFIANTDLTMVKKLVVHRYETAKQVSYETNFPEMLVLDTNDSLSGVEVRELAHMPSSAVSYLKYFSISNHDYKTIDGIVYTKNGKMVVAGSLGLEHVVIPEGVEKFGHSAFRNCKIRSVVLPGSMDRIRAKAFYQCKNLKSVRIGDNVDTIEESAFAECCSLKHIDIPAGIKTINDYAFFNSGLEGIELHEGLLCLGRKALFGTNIESVHLPASVKKLECNCFGSNLKELTMETFPSGFGAACTTVPGPFDVNDKIMKVYCNGKYLYFPRHIKPSMSSDVIDEIEHFFKNPRIKTMQTQRCVNVHVNNKNETFDFVIPDCVSATTNGYSEIVTGFNLLASDPEYCKRFHHLKWLHTAFMYASNSRFKYVCAYKTYKRTKNELAKEYLTDYQKRTADAIAMELTEKDFVDFLRLEFINLGYDEDIVKRLQEKNWTAALAYMLEEGKDSSNDALVI